MLTNLTIDQLAELRTALWNHYNAEYAEYSDELQALETGSAEMGEAISKWAVRRDNIKAVLAAVDAEINNRTKAVAPAARRIRAK